MTYSCNAAKKISNPAPPKAHIFRHGPMLGDKMRKLVVDVFSPIDVVPIGRIGQSWVKCEFQMVMRIDESRQKEKAGEVDYSRRI